MNKTNLIFQIQFQLFLTVLRFDQEKGPALFKACNLLKGYCGFSKVHCRFSLFSSETYNIDCFRLLRTLGIGRKKGLTAKKSLPLKLCSGWAGQNACLLALNRSIFFIFHFIWSGKKFWQNPRCLSLWQLKNNFRFNLYFHTFFPFPFSIILRAFFALIRKRKKVQIIVGKMSRKKKVSSPSLLISSSSQVNYIASKFFGKDFRLTCLGGNIRVMIFFGSEQKHSKESSSSIHILFYH